MPGTFLPFVSTAQTEKYKVLFLDVETRDTLQQSTVDGNSTFISFKSKKLEHKYDVVLLQKVGRQGSMTLHVPAQKGKTNTYRFVSENSLIPFSFEEEAQKTFLAFEGNFYLEAYNQLLALDSDQRETERENYVKAFITKLISFEKQFPNNQISAYHLLHLKSDMEKYFPAEIIKIAAKNSGYYYNQLKRQYQKEQNRVCITNRPDSLIFQSAKSKIELDPTERSIHVLIFWATWCGPCKPLIKQVNELNKTHYADSPVYFDAVTSEDDLMKTYNYFKDHPDFSSLGFFNDSEQCMQSNYAVTKLPTVLVFDKNKHLAARDPENLKEIIDKLLLQP